MLKATIYFSLALKCQKVMFDDSIPKYSYVIYKLEDGLCTQMIEVVN